MDHREVGRYWDANADAWTTLSRAGYDIDPAWVNTPQFFADRAGIVVLLPAVTGLVASFVPAARASRADPAEALRAD
jgi:hypothetical protein